MKTLHLTTWTFIGVALIMAAFAVVVPRAEAATCTFTRDLQLGVTGEDVKCLQQYLNTNGFEIAATGAGSPGNETGEYKALTEAAVKRWQTAKGITPASGTFGTLSRAMFRTGENPASGEVLGVSAPTTGSTASPDLVQALLKRIVSLEARVAALEGKKPTVGSTVVTPVTGGTKAEQAKRELAAARASYDDAESEVADADDDGEKVDEAEDTLDEVADMLDNADELYADKMYDRVIVLAKRISMLSAEAVDAIGSRGGSSDDEDLEDRLDDLREELDELRDDVERALDDDEDVGDAEDILDDAKDALDDAEDALDDDEEADAEDFLDEAEDLLEEADDEL